VAVSYQCFEFGVVRVLLLSWNLIMKNLKANFWFTVQSEAVVVLV